MMNIGKRVGNTSLKKQWHAERIQDLNKRLYLKRNTKKSKVRIKYKSFFKNFFIISLSFDIIS